MWQRRGVLLFSKSSVKFQGHTGQKISDYDPNVGVPDYQLQFEFTDGFEIMHKGWCGLEKLPFFQGHPSNF